MFRIEDVLLLKDDERVKTVTRRHLVTLFPGLFLALILIVMPFFLLFSLFAWGIPGVAIFFTALIAGLCIAFRTLLLWDSDVLIVTSLRLVDVDQRGLFSRIVSETPLASIQHVTWSKKGIIESVFRLGTIKVQTQSVTTAIEAQRIPHPQLIHELINDLRQHAVPMNAPQSGPAPAASPDPLKKISSLLEKYSPEELGRIESVLKARERSTVADAFFSGKEAEKKEDV